jgi:hypothetical protein
VRTVSSATDPIPITTVNHHKGGLYIDDYNANVHAPGRLHDQTDDDQRRVTDTGNDDEPTTWRPAVDD